MPSDNPLSPWYDGGAGTNQSGLATIPKGGFGKADGDNPAAGDTAALYHPVTVDTVQEIGDSQPEAAWEPAVLSREAGSAVTSLTTGAYRVAYAARGIPGPDSPGLTHIGLSESAVVNLVQGVSKPRVTFPLPPPDNCEYVLYLTPPGGARWGEMTYCTGITGDHVDLVGGNWANEYSAGVASGGPYTLAQIRSAGAPILPTTLNTAAVQVYDAGSLTITDGGYLLMRGDFLINTAAGATDDKFIIRGGGRFKFDGSLSPDPTRGNYTIWCSGGCKIFLAG